MEGETTYRLGRDTAELRAMRAWLVDVLARRPTRPGLVDDVVVMTGELAANALMHTSSAPEVRVAVGGEEIRISVHDDDPAPPVLEPVDPRRPRGNGLRIVDAWADSWGVEQDPGDGKDVWFSVRRW